MEPSPPALPRTIIVVDDYPNEVSAFLCGVLDAHALPYVVQVVDSRTPLFDHRAPLEARRAPTVIWLDRLRRPRAGDAISLKDLEVAHIKEVLAAGSSLQDSAEVLGLDLQALYRRRKQYGID